MKIIRSRVHDSLWFVAVWDGPVLIEERFFRDGFREDASTDSFVCLEEFNEEARRTMVPSERRNCPGCKKEQHFCTRFGWFHAAATYCEYTETEKPKRVGDTLTSPSFLQALLPRLRLSLLRARS